MKIGFRRSVNVDEAGIEAGGSKLEAVLSNWIKKFLSVEFRNNELRYELRQPYPSIEPY